MGQTFPKSNHIISYPETFKTYAKQTITMLGNCNQYKQHVKSLTLLKYQKMQGLLCLKIFLTSLRQMQAPLSNNPRNPKLLRAFWNLIVKASHQRFFFTIFMNCTLKFLCRRNLCTGYILSWNYKNNIKKCRIFLVWILIL